MSPKNADWLESLCAFFDQRGVAVSGIPTLDDLCYIAGRDPRVWRDEGTRTDLADSILGLTKADITSSILEVGCAAGFLAYLVAPRVQQFIGVDLAEAPLAVARRLGIANARFRQVHGGILPFPDFSFDAAFCYDVFTNFPNIEDGVPLIKEMLRVVRPGGHVLVGNLPDRLRAADLPARVEAVTAALEARYGPYLPPPMPEASLGQKEMPRCKSSFWGRVFGGVNFSALPHPDSKVAPMIVTYDFLREEFLAVGKRLGVQVELSEVHERNPYRGYRFNVVFSREI